MTQNEQNPGDIFPLKDVFGRIPHGMNERSTNLFLFNEIKYPISEVP